jgi:hypothetical protein
MHLLRDFMRYLLRYFVKTCSLTAAGNRRSGLILLQAVRLKPAAKIGPVRVKTPDGKRLRA